MKPRNSRAKLPANAPRQSENSAVAGEIADKSEPTHPVQRQRDPAAGSDNRHQTIREAAYRRFEARGRVHGRDLEDWLEAEAQLESSRDAKR
jgi:DUF2934 family protein